MRRGLICIPLIFLAGTGCSNGSSKPKATIYPAGEKATVGSLVYGVTDAETLPQLGTDPASARTPQDRFYLVKVSVSNSGNDEMPIEAMSLVDDAGQSHIELADGTNVPNWLGVVRKVGPAQTEEGYVVFDAPIKHYRMRLNDPLDEKEIAIDLPINFVHDPIKSIDPPSGPAANLPEPKK